jgi:hypothetical protein
MEFVDALKPAPWSANACVLEFKEAQMADAIKTGTILIRDDTLLPTGVPVESDVFLPGWRLVKNLERDGLDQKFHEAGCTFSSLPGEIGATVSGLDEQKTLHRAVEQILAKRESAEFNSLEIMRVVWETSKRFLGVRYVTVIAQSRHVHGSAPMFRAMDLPVA